MTIQELIDFLQKQLQEENINPDLPAKWGSSYEYSEPFDKDDFEIRHGHLYMNTYQGM